MRVILAKQYQGDPAVGGPEAALHRGTTRSFSAFLYRVGGASSVARAVRLCAHLHRRERLQKWFLVPACIPLTVYV